MTFEEANKIYIDWKEYMEINDKLGTFFVSLPESFLPYTKGEIEEALNIVAKSYFDEEDYKISDVIKNSISFLIRYKDDEEAAKDTLDNLKLKTPEIRKLYVRNLKRARDYWAEQNKNAPRCSKCGHIANVIRDNAN